MIDGFVSKTTATVDDFQAIDPLNPNAATKTLPLPAGATGFLSDFKPLAATCNPLVFLGQAAPSASCSLGLAASNASIRRIGSLSTNRCRLMSINHLDRYVLNHSLVWIQLHCLAQQAMV